jgi:hypothetical protein
MKILYFGDPIGCGNEDFEAESKYVKKYLKDFIFGKTKFDYVGTVDSMQPNETSYDILIFDFGGIGLGCSGLVSSLSRMILKLIEDRPNTLFVAWTTFTNDYLKDECEKELGDYPNLICRDMNNEEVIKGIKKWIKEND